MISSLSLSLSVPISFPFLSTEDIDQHRKHDSDSGLGSDNGDKRLSATEVSLLFHVVVCGGNVSSVFLFFAFNIFSLHGVYCNHVKISSCLKST